MFSTDNRFEISVSILLLMRNLPTNRDTNNVCICLFVLSGNESIVNASGSSKEAASGSGSGSGDIEGEDDVDTEKGDDKWTEIKGNIKTGPSPGEGSGEGSAELPKKSNNLSI